MTVLRSCALVVFALVFLAAPALAQTTTSPQPKAAQSGESFGEEVTLAAKTLVVVKGAATWDTAFDTLVTSFKTVLAALDKQGIKPAGLPITVYTSSDDTGFEFMAGYPVAEEPKGPLPPELSVAKSPAGKAVKFIHRGSYDVMDATYEKITAYFDEKKLETGDVFMEQYATDPLKTPEERLVIEVYFLVKSP